MVDVEVFFSKPHHKKRIMGKKCGPGLPLWGYCLFGYSSKEILAEYYELA
jgi:hypothetical protein